MSSQISADSPQESRSGKWLNRQDFEGWSQRGCLKSEGFSDASFRNRPVIGICNTWSELVHCNAHLRDVAEAVKRGVLQAGGFPLEFPVMSLGEPFMKPTSMLYRNLMAMDVEESIRAYPIDGVVLLVGCDKTTPACLMGAASANIPSIVVPGGPQLNAYWRGQKIGNCTDCWFYSEEFRAGRITLREWQELEESAVRSPGHCMTMGTASTMACVTEAIGMALPGSATIPAADSRLKRSAELAGRAIIDLVARDIKPSDIVTMKAFENAIRTLHAIGGSTNGIIHLIALAGRLGLELPLDMFEALSETTPWLLNLKPSGEYLMEDFFYAGGLPAVLAQIRDLLHLDALTVAGVSMGEALEGAETINSEVIAPRATPLSPRGALNVLYGNVCPDGAVIKVTAASENLLVHEGSAVVFENLADLEERLDDPDLEVDASSVLVLKNAGPKGAPGMPEAGHLPIPKKLLRAGVTDMVRISDARMSGTAYGTVVLHITPEAAVGGPLALVRTGDRIRLDVPSRRLDLLVPEAELARRRLEWRAPAPHFDRGFGKLYVEHVMQANYGCDFDFLRSVVPAHDTTAAAEPAPVVTG
ncbi:MAG: araC 1 [Chloroflexi bacterium]|nr:araC 1 [Chloroflexota bacterium]